MNRIEVKTHCLSLMLLYRKISCSHFSFGIVSISIFLELTRQSFQDIQNDILLVYISEFLLELHKIQEFNHISY